MSVNTVPTVLDCEAAARVRATELDASDEAPGAVTAPVVLQGHDTLTAEDAGVLDFTTLLGSLYHPVKPRDRIVHPLLVPATLDEAAESLVNSRSPGLNGRHNRYRPLPWEDALRTDDVADFLECYGHEYQVVVLRAVDVRTTSLLDLAELTAIARREGANVLWDWTGAVDWLPAMPEADVAGMFWTTHASLVDGRRIVAGSWTPADGPAPAEVVPAPLSAGDAARAARLAAFAAFAAVEVAGSGSVEMSVRHPDGVTSRLPLLVVAASAPEAAVDTLAAGPGFQSVVRYGERVVALPDPAATYKQILDRVVAGALTWKVS